MVYRNYVYLCEDIYINIWVVLMFRALVYGHWCPNTHSIHLYIFLGATCVYLETHKHTQRSTFTLCE